MTQQEAITKIIDGIGKAQARGAYTLKESADLYNAITSLSKKNQEKGQEEKEDPVKQAAQKK